MGDTLMIVVRVAVRVIAEDFYCPSVPVASSVQDHHPSAMISKPVKIMKARVAESAKMVKMAPVKVPFMAKVP
jgi:hypothetical protein